MSLGVPGSLLEGREDGAGVPGHRRRGDAPDPARLAEAPVVHELGHARSERRRPLAPRPTEIGEHRPRLDGRELRGISEKHEPGAARQGGEHPRHEGEVHHRRLVEDERVHPERPASRPREEPMHGARLGREGLELRDRGQQIPVASLAHRLLEAGGRLSGRGGERDPGGIGQPELDEKRDHRGHCRGLAGAGPPGHDAQAMANGGAGRRTRPVVRESGLRKETIERGREAGRLGDGGGRKSEDAGRGVALRGPEPFEVEPAVTVENERPALLRARPGHHRARRQRLEPGSEIRERRVSRFGPGPPRHIRQGEAGVPAPRPGARESGRDGHLRPATAVEVRGHRPEVPIDVGDVTLAAELVEARDGHAGPPRKSRSSPCTKDPPAGRTRRRAPSRRRGPCRARRGRRRPRRAARSRSPEA